MSSSDNSTPGADPRHLVAGTLVEGDGVDLTPINPATGEPLTTLRVSSLDQLEQSIAAAHAAQETWSATGKPLDVLGQIADRITDHRDLLARTLTLETGVPITQSTLEVDMAALFFKHRASIDHLASTVRADDREHVQTTYRPVGVVGAIIPWNAPLMIAAEKIGSALSLGNTVVLKSSPLAPLTVAAFARLISDIVPAGAVNVLAGDDDLGKALVAHDLTDMISFTGSTAAGRSIMASAAAGVKRLSLELGGNDPAVVLADVDPSVTARRIVMSAFYRSGQVCAAIKRVYVPSAIAAEFTEAAVLTVQKLHAGDPFDESTTLGPLSNQQQYDRVVALVDQVRRDGGEVLTGGEALPGPGLGYAPTIVTGAPTHTPLVAEEQFGPALPILVYDDEDEAVEAANGTNLGLGASVWTSDTDQGVRLAQRIRSGSVWINRHGLVMPDIPFGGMKQSGYGRTNGAAVPGQYGELQTVSVALPR